MLACTQYGSAGPTVILLHGLLGTKANMGAVAKQLSTRFQTFTLDLRNHGDSFHAPSMEYSEMAADIASFMAKRKISSATIIGHSMGGKCAMQFAASYPEKTDKLVIIDIAPKNYSQPEWLQYARAMYELDITRVTSRKQADTLLQKSITSPIYRQFLLSNLSLSELEGYYWKPNLKAILLFSEAISSNTITEPCYSDTIFIRGGASPYVSDSDTELLRELFPKSKLISIENTGHLVHFEAKDRFLKVLVDFL